MKLSAVVVSPRRTTRFHAVIPVVVLALLLLLSGARLAQAGYVETFDDGLNSDGWRLTTDPTRLLMVEPDGGNPGAYLHGEVDSAVPTWYVPLGTKPDHFLGDYALRRVGGLSFDLNIIQGSQVPDRNVTLDLKTTFGTGDFSQGVDAYYLGADISRLPVGWNTYSFPLNATSPTIPPGWVVTKGNGKPGTDADWQALMQDVETLGLELGTPGYFYPFFFWELGLDNVRIARQYRP
ncbi:MAG: hypothetical protein ACR2G0_09330 [Chthoniobacterales bacterium]